ncbi:MAG: hypothetical protein NTW78_04175 [Campylobacterales bacterium]|nr:hypothetical protein [Campylobacterales bacterium]
MYNFKEIIKITSQIESDKTAICREWVNAQTASEVFKRTGLDKKKFETLFAPRIINYFLDVANDKEEIGNCPVIGVMLAVFHKLNLQIDDVFLICVALKNILNKRAVTSSNEILFDEINYIFDNNLKGVIQEYIQIHYPTLRPRAKVHTIKHEDFYTNKISAESFLEMEMIDSDLIDDLNDFEKDFDALISATEGITAELIDEIQKLLNLYMSVLHQIIDFKELYSHVIYFKTILSQINVDNITDKQAKKYNEIINSILSDLITWKNEIFITKSAKDIHYLDDSIFSSIKQMEMISGNYNQEENEMELF